jgi:hypothetical protein
VEVLPGGAVLSTSLRSSVTMVESIFEPCSVVAMKQKLRSSCLESRGGRPFCEVEALVFELIHKQTYGENENPKTGQD